MLKNVENPLSFSVLNLANKIHNVHSIVGENVSQNKKNS